MKTLTYMMVLFSTHVLALNDPMRPVGKYAQQQNAAANETQSQSSNKNKTARFVLSSTLIRGSHKYAIINGKLKKQGDLVDDMKISSIGLNHVILTGSSRKVTLRLVDDIKTLSQERQP